jgi:hypothetical protein
MSFAVICFLFCYGKSFTQKLLLPVLIFFMFFCFLFYQGIACPTGQADFFISYNFNDFPEKNSQSDNSLSPPACEFLKVKVGIKYVMYLLYNDLLRQSKLVFQADIF